MAVTRYMVSYDIRDAKRLRRVATTLEGFGTRVQYSLFECPLNELLLAELKAELGTIISHSHDQVLFISLGASSKSIDLLIDYLGTPYLQRDGVTVV